MISDREKALLHIYPALADIGEEERRNTMMRLANVYSTKQKALTQQHFEIIMAEFEAVLWLKVEAGTVPDPRSCRKCGRRLQRLDHGVGICRAGHERRKVYAWEEHYWRDRLPQAGRANTRQIHKIKQLWELLTDFLDEDLRDDKYLAKLLSSDTSRVLSGSGQVDWKKVTAREAHNCIEALKDRLQYSVSERGE